MVCWIAYEHTDDGWPTDAFLLLIADTAQEAQRRMIKAIDARAAAAPVKTRARLYAIFVEAPQPLPPHDPRGGLITDPTTPVFFGFDDPDEAEPSDRRTAARRPRGGHRRSA